MLWKNVMKLILMLHPWVYFFMLINCKSYSTTFQVHFTRIGILLQILMKLGMQHICYVRFAMFEFDFHSTVLSSAFLKGLNTFWAHLLKYLYAMEKQSHRSIAIYGIHSCASTFWPVKKLAEAAILLGAVARAGEVRYTRKHCTVAQVTRSWLPLPTRIYCDHCTCCIDYIRQKLNDLEKKLPV